MRRAAVPSAEVAAIRAAIRDGYGMPDAWHDPEEDAAPEDAAPEEDESGTRSMLMRVVDLTPGLAHHEHAEVIRDRVEDALDSEANQTVREAICRLLGVPDDAPVAVALAAFDEIESTIGEADLADERRRSR